MCLAAEPGWELAPSLAGTKFGSSNRFPVMRTRVYTAGYEGRSLDDLLEALTAAGVRRLVDVRELPLSRKPGFSKSKLAAALEEVGIEYRHVKDLGNPKPYRQLYYSGDIKAGAAAYRRHLSKHSNGALAELAESLDGPTCLLCFERDHARCHRAVIVESLLRMRPSLAVSHL